MQNLQYVKQTIQKAQVGWWKFRSGDRRVRLPWPFLSVLGALEALLGSKQVL